MAALVAVPFCPTYSFLTPSNLFRFQSSYMPIPCLVSLHSIFALHSSLANRSLCSSSPLCPSFPLPTLPISRPSFRFPISPAISVPVSPNTHVLDVGAESHFTPTAQRFTVLLSADHIPDIDEMITQRTARRMSKRKLTTKNLLTAVLGQGGRRMEDGGEEEEVTYNSLRNSPGSSPSK